MGNELPDTLNAPRTVDTIKAELARLEAAIKTVEAGYWRATADITKRGLTVRVQLARKVDGKKSKLRANPALALQSTARATLKGLREDMELLLAEIAAIEKAAKRAEADKKFDFLNLKPQGEQHVTGN